MMGSVVAGRTGIGNVVCDLDGVVYLLDEPVPGAGRALMNLDARGYALLFVTNNSTRSPATIAARIENLTGYPAAPDQVIGSAEAALTLLEGGTGPAFVLGGDGIRHAMAIAGVAETDDPGSAAAVIVGLDTGFSYQRLRDAATAVRSGATFIATNADATYPTPQGLWPGAGAMVAAVQAATGIEPVIAGKPHEPIRRLIRARLGPGPVWVVGDRPETDLAMAKVEGWVPVLVLTGVVAAVEEVAEEDRPDLILSSLTDLPEALQS
ncbi:MAG: HAD-IIA family hydrolase [Acidimicrobiia bacterium]